MATTVKIKDYDGVQRSYAVNKGIRLANADGTGFETFTQGGGASVNVERAWSGGAVKSRDYTQSTYAAAVAALTKTASVTLPVGASVQSVYCKQLINGVASTSGSDYAAEDYGTALSDASVTTAENQDGTVTVTGTTDISRLSWYPAIFAGSDYGGVASYIYLEVTYT